MTPDTRPIAWQRMEILFEQRERELFKEAHHGLRDAAPSATVIGLRRGDDEALFRRKFLERASHRRYAAQPLPVDSLAKLLGCLRALSIDGKLKYAYGSAGSSYAVQTYLYVKPDRVSGLLPGTWLYHPVEHRLSSLRLDARIGGEVHYFDNRLIYESSAFSLFLVGRMEAIAPLYGDKSRDFALIEAGLMTQLLEMTAPSAGLGLCQIGDMQFDRVRDAFLLGPNDILVHSLTGGALPA